MADLKEENPVETNTNNPVEEQEGSGKKTIDPSLEGFQLFYEKNKKMVNYVGGGLALLIAGLVYFKMFYLPEQEKEAANEMYVAEYLFEKDSFNMALRGGVTVMTPDGQKQIMGFEDIAANYGITRNGNLAYYYAGICYLRTGKYEQAIENLKQYEGKDAVISSIAIGAIGDANLELKNNEEAIKYYLKAADNNNNSFTTPFYLKKAGFAYEISGNYAQALAVYERINREFGSSEEGREIARDIAKVKALGNL